VFDPQQQWRRHDAKRRRRCRGFEHEGDASRFLEGMRARLAQFRLPLNRVSQAGTRQARHLRVTQANAQGVTVSGSDVAVAILRSVPDP
jgi:hypothetical protein